MVRRKRKKSTGAPTIQRVRARFRILQGDLDRPNARVWSLLHGTRRIQKTDSQKVRDW